jgi:Xaa-Pro aminopeptidase
MYGERVSDGTVEPRFGVPNDRRLDPGEQFVFSFELIGPLGYWMEFARMVAIGEPTELQQRLNAAVKAGMNAGEAALHPGTRPDQVQRAILDAVEPYGVQSAYWTGHGLGHDVIEEPWIGLEVVQDRDVPSGWTLERNMVVSMHPYVSAADGSGVGYMADSYIVGEGAVSKVPLDLYVVR